MSTKVKINLDKINSHFEIMLPTHPLMTLGDANVINENTQVLQQTSLLDIDDIR